MIACCVWLFLLSLPIAAQEHGKLALSGADSLPPQIVLVLRLVSSTHVEPTTGVVISESGLVLVPADFATPDDEVVVLDGGTDIIRNGRPAKIERRFFSEGLTVLSVPGLKRPPVSLSGNGAENGNVLHLTAFPPAEMIAQGASPLSTPATVIIFGESGRPGISSESPLPNVTGPLLDDCGKLVGMSTADGVQSMSTSEVPRYHWVDSIKRVAAQVDVTLSATPCVPEPEAMEPEAVEPEAVEPELPEEEPPAEPEQEPEAPVEVAEEVIEEGALAEEVTPEADAEEESAGEELLDSMETLPPHESGEIDQQDQNATAEPSSGPAWMRWLWLPGAAFLFGLAWVIHRLRRSRSTSSARPTDSDDNDPADDPDTQFPVDPAPLEAAPSMDSVLMVEGMTAEGESFRHSCPVSKLAVNVVIGRANSDINIDSPAISRHHATLNGKGDSLTLSDLGSSNGTSINGVPCYEDEIMYVGPEDTIILGDVRFSCEVISRQEASERDKE